MNWSIWRITLKPFKNTPRYLGLPRQPIRTIFQSRKAFLIHPTPRFDLECIAMTTVWIHLHYCGVFSLLFMWLYVHPSGKYDSLPELLRLRISLDRSSAESSRPCCCLLWWAQQCLYWKFNSHSDSRHVPGRNETVCIFPLSANPLNTRGNPRIASLSTYHPHQYVALWIDIQIEHISSP